MPESTMTSGTLSHRSSLEINGTVDLSLEHNKIKNRLLKQLSDFTSDLRGHPRETIDDPRLGDEVATIKLMAVLGNTSCGGVDELRSKVKRDEKYAASMRPNDFVVWNLRKYRIVLHDLGGTQDVDTEVVAATTDFLTKLKREVRRRNKPSKTKQVKASKEAEVEKKIETVIEEEETQSEDEKPQLSPQEHSEGITEKQETQGEAAIQEENVRATAEEVEGNDNQGEAELLGNVIHWPQLGNFNEDQQGCLKPEDIPEEESEREEEERGAGDLSSPSGLPSEVGDSQDEIEVNRQVIVGAALERLEVFAAQMDSGDELSLSLKAQVIAILQISEGKSDEKWEIGVCKLDVLEPQGDDIESLAVRSLQHYRIFLDECMKREIEVEVDKRLVGIILQMLQFVLADNMGLCDADRISTDSEESKERFEDAETETSSDHEYIPCEGPCSCGKKCEIARLRPPTPEGELSRSERKLRDWYETRQVLLKQQTKSIAYFLDVHTEQVDAGDLADPVIRLYAKKLKKLSRGKNEEGISEEEEEEDPDFPDATDWHHERFRVVVREYYYQCLDPDCDIELDDDVVEACNKFLKVVSQKHLAAEKEKILGIGSDSE
ncbi:hypothetical protein BDZ45DRAFT_752634 [Acephala macrosclerotiorum]|nr:hypothetical protein BDZ45DRAFT_752634 [Acephala macrosclerotiorum]